MNSDCKRPEIERCGVCDVCQSLKSSKLGEDVVKEATKEIKNLKWGCLYVTLFMFGMCAAVGAGIGLVYVGFKMVIDLFRGE